MKRMLFAVTALMFVFSGFLRAEDALALLRKQYQAVSDEWKEYISPERRNLARNSPDPQIRREMRFRQELLEELVQTCCEIQKVLEKLNLGDDLPVARHAENVRGSILLYERAAQKGQPGTKKGKTRRTRFSA